jgi:hypothetical protein
MITPAVRGSGFFENRAVSVERNGQLAIPVESQPQPQQSGKIHDGGGYGRMIPPAVRGFGLFVENRAVFCRQATKAPAGRRSA